MKAVACFNKKLKGFVKFQQKQDYVLVSGEISGLYKNKLHAIHIHEYGDLTDGCNSMGGHLNPFNKNHGGRDDKERHVGDLGNIQADHRGNCTFRFRDSIISLKNNKRNILGRGVVIHKGTDDCGDGNHKDSLKTGNAGARLDCAVIGVCK